jgi:hypothetical protein
MLLRLIQVRVKESTQTLFDLRRWVGRIYIARNEVSRCVTEKQSGQDNLNLTLMRERQVHRYILHGVIIDG